MPDSREIAITALVGLPIWWVGWHLLDALWALIGGTA